MDQQFQSDVQADIEAAFAVLVALQDYSRINSELFKSGFLLLEGANDNSLAELARLFKREKVTPSVETSSIFIQALAALDCFDEAAFYLEKASSLSGKATGEFLISRGFYHFQAKKFAAAEQDYRDAISFYKVKDDLLAMDQAAKQPNSQTAKQPNSQTAKQPNSQTAW
ncbi:MAG: hypothetical protein HQM08_29390 [Candidatus Riflebacteria bacterium]|nr:hypothetical protein [Candidatus Riflebacteria bacterium]